MAFKLKIGGISLLFFCIALLTFKFVAYKVSYLGVIVTVAGILFTVLLLKLSLKNQFNAMKELGKYSGKVRIPYFILHLGLIFLMFGGAMNLSVMVANGGSMPVMYPGPEVDYIDTEIHHYSSWNETNLSILSDWIIINFGIVGLASIGDLVALVGILLTFISAIVFTVVIILFKIELRRSNNGVHKETNTRRV